MVSSGQHTPKIAVITRTKDRPQFLERSIKSVLAQTVDNFVHVILNDGGDRQEVERVISKYPDSRRIIVHNSQSMGLSIALNQAIKASKSEFIAILDDDDAWHKDRLKASLDVVTQRDAVATIVPMEIVVEDVMDSGEIKEVDRKPHPESWSGEVSLFKQAHRNYLSNGAIMYSRAVYDELGGYNESLPTAEDWDFGIRLMLKYNVEQVISEKALVYYHQRPLIKGSIGNSVHAGVREQERAITILRNNYLRDDIKKGAFGIGYIMNHSEQELINIVRLEGHINRTASDVEDVIVGRIRDDTRRILNTSTIRQKLKKLVGRSASK